MFVLLLLFLCGTLNESEDATPPPLPAVIIPLAWPTTLYSTQLYISPSSPTVATMLPSSNSSSAAAAYKGKTSHRSWNNLPAEFVRLIVTHFLLDASSTSTGYSPKAWEPRDRWLNHMAYDVVRNANALENLMQVSPAWRVASQLFYFILVLFGCFHHVPSLFLAPSMLFPPSHRVAISLFSLLL